MSIENLVEKLLDTPPHRILVSGIKEANYAGYKLEVEARELNEDGILIPYVLIRVKKNKKSLLSIETFDLYSWKFLVVYDQEIKEGVEKALKRENVRYVVLNRKPLIYELRQETDY